MSDTDPQGMDVSFSNDRIYTANPKGDIYPNAASYNMSTSTPQGARGGRPTLRKAMLYSIRRAGSGPLLQGPSTVDGRPLESLSINTRLVKKFQFNPPDFNMRMAFEPTDHPDSLVQGGTTAASQSLGLASVDVEMLFERSLEMVNRADPNDAYYRLGVAKDFLDVFGVISGESSFLQIDDSLTFSDLTESMSNLVAQGSDALISGHVAVQYSPDFIIYGKVTSLRFRFVKYNARLVPTMGYIEVGIEIFRSGAPAYINNFLVGKPEESDRPSWDVWGIPSQQFEDGETPGERSTGRPRRYDF